MATAAIALTITGVCFSGTDGGNSTFSKTSSVTKSSNFILSVEEIDDTVSSEEFLRSVKKTSITISCLGGTQFEMGM